MRINKNNIDKKHAFAPLLPTERVRGGNISSETSRPMTEAGLLACYDTSSRMYDTVYVEIVGSLSPHIAARGIRVVKVIVTRVRT